jgi:hypothetical protein
MRWQTDWPLVEAFVVPGQRFALSLQISVQKFSFKKPTVPPLEVSSRHRKGNQDSAQNSLAEILISTLFMSCRLATCQIAT